MASRVTQTVVEVLATTTPQPRVTQHLAEVLTHELPLTGIRVEQHLVEVLTTTGAPVWVTQHVLEAVWVELPFLGALVTQHLVEVLSTLAPAPPEPVPGMSPPSGGVQLAVQLQAELLTPDGRVPFARSLTLPGEVGDVVEVVLPDGTLSRPVLPARAGQVVALLVTSDKAVQVCVGDVAQNQALMLAPWGIAMLLGSDMPGEQTCALSYAPGDGSVATCVVLVLIQART